MRASGQGQQQTKKAALANGGKYSLEKKLRKNEENVVGAKSKNKTTKNYDEKKRKQG